MPPSLELEKRFALATPQSLPLLCNILNLKVRFRENTGSTVCKVSDLTVAYVGFSMTSLKRMERGGCARYVTVHSPDHTLHYPGAGGQGDRTRCPI